MRLAGLLAIILTVHTYAAIRPQSHPYRNHWKQSVVGKHAIAGVAAGATATQIRRGGGPASFGKRLGTGAATHVAGTTVEHAIAAPLHEDLHYHRSNKRGFTPRLGHALASTVVTRNTRSGKRTPAVGRISGHAAAGALSQGVLAGASGASTAGVALAAVAGATVAREFIPPRP